MATFIELRFHAIGEQAHAAALERIEQVPGIDVLLDHTRELGWLERQRLRVEEWDCRVVVWVRDRAELRLMDRLDGQEGDPYRTVEFGEAIRMVPAQLADLIEELGAEHALVDVGWLRFETRIYESALLEQLEAELVGICDTYVDAQLVREFGVLRGRMQGQIPVIRQLHRTLQRCGMLDAEQLLVGYN